MLPVPSPYTTLTESAATSAATSSALQVSPVTFKSLLSSLIDVLGEQSGTSIVWAKLPSGEAWQQEINRCSQVTTQTYLFQMQREVTTDAATDTMEHSLGPPLNNQETSQSDSQETPSQAVLTQDAAAASPILLSLPHNSALKREYFLLIWSASFCVALTSQRSLSPRSARFTETGTEVAEKKQALMIRLSFDPRTVQQVLDHLQQVSDLNWQEHLATIATVPENSPLWGRLLIGQLSRQEELLQRSTGHRLQREIVQRLKTRNEELMNLLRLKDELLSSVGQELRAPLTSMKTALTLLQSPTLKPQQRQRYLELLTQECDRQSTLVASLLNLASLAPLEAKTAVQALDLATVIPVVVSTSQPSAMEKNIRLSYLAPEDLPAIAGLSNWLRQIVTNLLHNAIKFTPEGGQVLVRAKQQGNFVQLEFKDTGIGIPPQELPKIFDRFYRVRQNTGEDPSGAGLGLTIVQKLLSYCGGSISVKSRVGEGSTFQVLLPIYQEAASEATVSKATVSKATVSKATVSEATVSHSG